MHRHPPLSRVALASLSLTAATVAQSVVSPAEYALQEGVSIGSFPFSALSRYQQVHKDLTGTARAFRAIAFRRDGRFATDPRAAARTLEVELRMADGDHATFSSTFAANYQGPVTTVFAKKTIATPDWTALPRQQPARFDFVFVLDAPYAYSGARDLLWEAAITQTSAPGMLFPCDAATSGNLVGYGSYVMNGTGCTTQNGVMEQRSNLQSNRIPGGDNLTFRWSTTGAPSNAAATLWLGFTNPVLPFPGLCTFVYVLPVADASATTSATGTFDVTLPPVQMQPGYIGFTFESQALALDPTQPGALKVAASNGLSSTVRAVPGTFDVSRLYNNGDPVAATGTLNPTLADVVRFDQ
jgi:hypothetical protein